MLPLFLSFSNKLKVGTKWLVTGNEITKEEVERAIKEQKEGVHLEEDLAKRPPKLGESLNGSNEIHEDSSKALEVQD